MKVCPVCGTEYSQEAAFCSRDRSPLVPAKGSGAQGLVGQLVGERYQVERRIGEGGMGEVYLARHILMGRPCALKVMSPALSRDPDAVTRFNREATSASRISHPNVCAVYDFGLTADGLVYLAMEFVEGRTLSALVEESGPLPVRRATELLGQCAAGLAAAHELGIVHRDLKPDNVMVLTSKDREVAKLVDFGIAKAIEGVGGQRVTKTGFVVGTPEYMSPEQLSGDPVDARSDQYSLALVFYRLIAGQLPFEGDSLQETLVKRLTDPPRPLAACRPEARFPAGLQSILDRALARYAEERYPSVLEFTGAIQAAVQADEVTTQPIAVPGTRRSIPPTRQSPAAARGRGARIAAGAVGLLLLAGAAWGVLNLSGAPGGAGADSVVGTATPPAQPPATIASSSLATNRGSAPVPAPAPASPQSQRTPPPPPPPQPASAEPADTGELSLDALESPALRLAEITRARRQLATLRLPPHRRAAAAAFLGSVLLEAGRRDTALILFRIAYQLDPKPNYLRAIRQFGDTIQP